MTEPDLRLPSLGPRGAWRLAAVCATSVILLAAAAWTVVGLDGTADPVAPVVAERPTPVPDGTGSTGGRRGPLQPSEPVRLEVPSVGIDAMVDSLELTGDAVLEPPTDIDRVGWWSESARPGADVGQTVMTGHSVHTGAGEMTKLIDVAPGASVDVIAETGGFRYRITAVQVIGREELSQRAQDIFGQDRRAGRLVLVTCANWDGSEWEDNLVVYARPLGSPRPARRA